MEEDRDNDIALGDVFSGEGSPLRDLDDEEERGYHEERRKKSSDQKEKRTPAEEGKKDERPKRAGEEEATNIEGEAKSRQDTTGLASIPPRDDQASEEKRTEQHEVLVDNQKVGTKADKESQRSNDTGKEREERDPREERMYRDERERGHRDEREREDRGHRDIERDHRELRGDMRDFDKKDDDDKHGHGPHSPLKNGCCRPCMKAFSESKKACLCQVPADVRMGKLPENGCRICGCHGCHPEEVMMKTKGRTRTRDPYIPVNRSGMPPGGYLGSFPPPFPPPSRMGRGGLLSPPSLIPPPTYPYVGRGSNRMPIPAPPAFPPPPPEYLDRLYRDPYFHRKYDDGPYDYPYWDRDRDRERDRERDRDRDRDRGRDRKREREREWDERDFELWEREREKEKSRKDKEKDKDKDKDKEKDKDEKTKEKKDKLKEHKEKGHERERDYEREYARSHRKEREYLDRDREYLERERYAGYPPPVPLDKDRLDYERRREEYDEYELARKRERRERSPPFSKKKERFF